MYRHLQKSLYKGLCPKLSTNMRKDITHDGYTSEQISEQYIIKKIEEAKSFLMTVENA